MRVRYSLALHTPFRPAPLLINVRCEFQSLMQYVEIYRRIYGDALRAFFGIFPKYKIRYIDVLLYETYTLDTI